MSRGTRSASSGGTIRRVTLTGGVFKHAPHGHDQVLLGDVGLFHDQLDEAGAFLLLLLQQFLHLLRRQQAVLDQGVGDAFSKCFDGWHKDQRKALPRMRIRSVGEARYHSSRIWSFPPGQARLAG